MFKPFKAFNAPASILPRVAGEDEGGGLNDWNDWNGLNGSSHEYCFTSAGLDCGSTF